MVLVGALLAATTSVIGATVVTVGTISLPALLRAGYPKSLATGLTAATGTLGQIVPPSIVLVILAHQLSTAVSKASGERRASYKEITGSLTMPSELDVTSLSSHWSIAPMLQCSLRIADIRTKHSILGKERRHCRRKEDSWLAARPLAIGQIR